MAAPRLLLLALLAMLCAAAPAEAVVSLGDPETVGVQGRQPQALTTNDGGMTVAWLGQPHMDPDPPTDVEGIYVTHRPNGGTFGPVQRVTSENVAAFLLASTFPRERALAWGESVGDGGSKLMVARTTYEGPFGAPEEVPGASSDAGSYTMATSLAIAADGTVALGWLRSHYDNSSSEAIVSLRTPSGVWSHQVLSSSSPSGPRLGADTYGTLMVTWSGIEVGQEATAPRSLFFAERPSRGAAFGAPHTLATGGPLDADNNFSPPEIDVDTWGSVLVTWNPREPSIFFPDHVGIARRIAGGSWTTQVVEVQGAMRPSGALNSAGDAVVAWNTPGGLGAFRLPADGSAGDLTLDPATLPGSKIEPMPLQMDAIGHVVLARRFAEPATEERVQLAVRPPGGCFGDPVDASPAGLPVDRPSLSLHNDGSGVVAWAEQVGPVWNVRVRDVMVHHGGREGCDDAAPSDTTIPPPQPEAQPDARPPGEPETQTGAGPLSVQLGRVPTRVSRKALRRGLALNLRTDRPAQLTSQLVRTGRQAKRLAKRVLPPAEGARFTRLKVSRKLLARLKRGNRLELRVTAAAGDGAIAAATRRLRLR